jgi:hypothetical protein
MHLGYMQVSKADGSQALDLQRKALLAAGSDRNTSRKIWRQAGATTAPA